MEDNLGTEGRERDEPVGEHEVGVELEAGLSRSGQGGFVPGREVGKTHVVEHDVDPGILEVLDVVPHLREVVLENKVAPALDALQRLDVLLRERCEQAQVRRLLPLFRISITPALTRRRSSRSPTSRCS